MCNGALMVCLNSLVLANHKQTFIENMLKLVDSTPLSSLMLICVNNQTIEWSPKTSNREKLVTLIAITEATGGLSYQIRKGTLTRAFRFYPNQFHTSTMKNNFQVFKTDKFEFTVTVHYGVWAKCSTKNNGFSLDRLELKAHNWRKWKSRFLTWTCHKNLQINTDFPSQFCIFTLKLPSVTQRLVSQKCF